ncbi:MAG: SDR family oxidoreductase [Burkholderiales bacterium]|nr:SDR family oxidoreductase [Burkholderiales bacterium]
MKVKDAIVLVTGANRGFGLQLVHELIARGAKKVYAGMRTPVDLGIEGVVPVKLDVTNADDVAAAAALCSDTTLLVNNAGIAQFGGYLDANSIDIARDMFETNYYGVIRMSQAFAPVLKANGGGGIVNVLSVASWISSPLLGPYAATKSAVWSFTNTLRQHLSEQGTQVLGLHVGFMDTDMTHGIEFPKTDPRVVAAKTLDALEAGKAEVFGDELTEKVKLGLSAEQAVYLAPVVR